MKKKSGTLLVISLACMGLFTACTSSADVMPQPSPTAGTNGMVTSAPQVTATPGATQSMSAMPAATAEPATVGAANTVADAQRISDRVEDEVEKLSEVDEASAVVVGNVALVGISYDDQYKSGLTDRLKGMVTDRVEMTDKTITAVHVTDDETLRKSIEALNDTMDGADASFDHLQAKVLELAAKLTGGNLTKPETTAGTT